LELSFNRYYDYEELTAALRSLAGTHPELGTLSSLGQSPEGRETWLFTITGPGRPPSAKPAYCIDANHHAGEVTGSMVTLYTIWFLLTNYGKDEAITRLLDGTTFYCIPRLAMDGAEAYLKTPETLRSAPRYYPDPQPEHLPGLYPYDVDGNGHILLMRVPDPTGEWKVSARDKRMLVRRAPDDDGDTYYRIWVEGMLRDGDGGEIRPVPPKWGLDFNRNYPVEWRPEHRQRGAGPYPLSEPETRMLADFILAHPNIGGSVTYHTSGGVILHPPGTREPSDLPEGDLQILKTIGQLGTEATGYPCVPILGGFTDKENMATGAFDDWLYEHLGIPSYTVELWAISQRAGLPSMWPRRQRSAQEQEDDLFRIFQWNDWELAGQGFWPWTPFQHPQLGKVELGGWLPKFVVQNPPPHLLPAECHKNMVFTFRHARTLPRLILDETRVQDLGDGAYKIETTVANHGYLATYLTRQGLDRNKARPVVVELLGEGFEVVSGKPRVECGHLEGRSARRGTFALAYYFSPPSEPSQKRLTWVIKAKGTARVHIKASSDKAGEVSTEVTI